MVIQYQKKNPVQADHDLTPPGTTDRSTQLRSQAFDDPVQGKMGGDGVGDVHAAAAHGISGSGGSLPHLDAIQRSFGGHDVSNVQAHVGGRAAEGAQSMGAKAFATGNHTAHARSPGLHEAAHEAAHVVQQRAGVQLSGGVGKVGDSYEQHADRVADTVVSGGSAEGLLSQMTGGTPGVQAKEDDSVQQQSADGPVQMNEEEGAWLQQQQLTKDSFFDLVNQNIIACDEWHRIAEVVDPPPAWMSVLQVVGTIALAAALGGVGGVLAGSLIKEGMKLVVQFAINAAIEAGKKGIEEGVNAAVGAATGSGDGAALNAFVANQKYGLVKSQKAARESFVMQAGTTTNQQMTIADMAALKTANDSAFSNARTLQMRQLLVGWMNMVGGSTPVKDSDLQDTSAKGRLGLEIEGSADRPTRIVRAETEGINESLRNQMSGTNLGLWTNHRGGANKGGIAVTAFTKSHGFTVSDATWRRIEAAGKAPHGLSQATTMHAIHFAIGKEANGGTGYYDNDWDGIMASDAAWGADAGRWFLSNVRNITSILTDLDGMTLPSVNR